MKAVDVINIEGPFGFFVINKNDLKSSQYIFLATGTGISPFKSFIRTYPEISYLFIHGIRIYGENYGKGTFPLL